MPNIFLKKEEFNLLLFVLGIATGCIDKDKSYHEILVNDIIKLTNKIIENSEKELVEITELQNKLVEMKNSEKG